MSLDLSCTASGVVIMTHDSTIPHDNRHIVSESTVGFDLKRDATVAERTMRLMHIANHIVGVASRYIDKKSLIVIERYAYSRRGAQNDLGELHGVVRAKLIESGFLNIEYKVATSARASVLGKGFGRANKKKIESTLIERGFIFDNNNVMDAWVIGAAVLGIKTFEEPTTKVIRKKSK